MSDFWRALFEAVVAVNPAAVALAAGGMRFPVEKDRRAAIGVGAAVASALLLVAALGAGRFLGALDIAPETFRIAAAIVMLTVGIYAVWRARVGAAVGSGSLADGVFPLGIPLLAGPAVLAAVISISADDGRGTAIGAAAGALALAIALALVLRPGASGRQAAVLDAAARVLGALLVVVAVARLVDGVRAI